MSECQQMKEKLPGLIDGELAIDEALLVKTHLTNCKDCREEKRRQEQFTTKVKTSLEDLKPSEFFVKGVLDKLGKDAVPRPASAPDSAKSSSSRISLLVGGLLLVAALIAILFAATRGRTPRVAEITGFRGASLLPAGSKEGRKPTRYISAGGRLQTNAQGKVLLRTNDGGELLLGASGLLEAGKICRLESGTLRVKASAETDLKVVVGNLVVTVKAGSQVRLSMQYAQTLTLEVFSGQLTVAGGHQASWRDSANLTAKDVRRLPLDGSGPPEAIE
jgi:Putative zinc-finger